MRRVIDIHAYRVPFARFCCAFNRVLVDVDDCSLLLICLLSLVSALFSMDEEILSIMDVLLHIIIQVTIIATQVLKYEGFILYTSFILPMLLLQ